MEKQTMLYTFRFFNSRKTRIVAYSLEDALGLLSDEQKKDLKGFTAYRTALSLINK